MASPRPKSASNGSPTTVNSVNLFADATVASLGGLGDFADIFALSNLTVLNGQTDASHLLVLSQETGKIIEIDRAGTVLGSLTIAPSPGDLLSIPDMQHEGLTMDEDGILYVVSENGGGDINHPQLWVYAPSPVPLPAAVWLLGSALSGLAVRRRRVA